MKTTNLFKLIIALFFPIVLNAQWSAVRFDHNNIFENVFTITADTVFVIGSPPVVSNYQHFLLRTNNGGINWDSITINNSSLVHPNILSQFFLNGTMGFVGGYENGKDFLLKTIDNGNTWSEIKVDTTSLGGNGIRSIFFIDPLNGWVTDGWNDIFKTTNGGASWTSITISSPIHDIYFLDANNGYGFGEGWLGTGAMVFKTNDGGQTWNGIFNTSAPNLFVSSFDKGDAINQNIIFTSLNGTNKLYKTINAGNTWDTIIAPVQYINDFDFTSADTGHIVSAAGEIFATIDGGKNWTFEYATAQGAYGPNVSLYSLSFVGQTGYVCGNNGLVKKHTLSNGINEKLSNNNIRIYPNPLSGTQNLYIEIKQPIESGIVKILNALGQVISQEILYNIPENSIISLSETNLPEGVYYLCIETKNSRSTQKLIVTE